MIAILIAVILRKSFSWQRKKEDFTPFILIHRCENRRHFHNSFYIIYIVNAYGSVGGTYTYLGDLCGWLLFQHH